MRMTRKEFFVASAAALALPAFPAAGVKRRIAVVKGNEVFCQETSSATLDRLLAEKNDVVFVDLQDAVAYPSHPEIATARSLAADKAGKIVSFYRSKGVELLPLVDFATCNDAWLGEYDRMVCSKPYRKVVEDVISDVSEIFGKPRAIHIGFEYEGTKDAAPNEIAVMRQGDLWMREFVWTVGLVEKAGAACWAWFDYPWGIKDFVAGCPRSVTLVNLKPVDEKMEKKLVQIEKLGVTVERREVAK